MQQRILASLQYGHCVLAGCFATIAASGHEPGLYGGMTACCAICAFAAWSARE